MLIHVKVRPNSSQEKIVKISNAEYNVWLKEKPVDNKANIKLTKLFKKHFKKQIKIKSGLTSRKKVVEVI